MYFCPVYLYKHDLIVYNFRNKAVTMKEDTSYYSTIAGKLSTSI